MKQTLDWQPLIRFWFETISPKQWWYSDADFDRGIASRFGEQHQQACAGELHAWRQTPKGSLAEILLLDQISRHIYRGDARSYAFDGMALVLSQLAIEKGFDKDLIAPMRQFLYLPWQHSESLHIQKQSLVLYRDPDIKGYQSAQKHFKVIEQFGRFPHRNRILNRVSTPQELAYLEKNPNPF